MGSSTFLQNNDKNKREKTLTYMDLNIPKTTAYVGKIPSTLDERWLIKLFKSCGSINTWKPMIDPETKRSKGFGFVDFEKPEGVLCALRLLNKLEVDGSCLIVKVNTSTQKYLEVYMRQKTESESIASTSTMPFNKKITLDKLNSSSAFISLQTSEAVNDCRVLKNIDKILKDRLIISKTETTEKNSITSEKRRIVNELKPDIKKEKPIINSSKNVTPNINQTFENNGQCIIQKKKQEIEIEKEKQEYDFQVHDWERYEDERRRNLIIHNSIKKKQANDRKKAIIQDEELVSSDGELGNWQRKLVRFSRKSEIRRYTKICENFNDDRERLKQIKEIKKNIHVINKIDNHSVVLSY